MSSNLKLEYLFSEPEELDPTALPDYTTLDFVSNGSHIYGEIMWPSANFDKPHPCVIMLHGFPGTARNNDISHALCRIGCVVIVPHNRGAWGSQGKYLITNCTEDAYNLAEYAHSEEFARKYDVAPDQIYLLGHSMGANSALNAGKKLEKHPIKALQKRLEYPTEHGLLGRRINVIQEIAAFIDKTAGIN